MPTLYITEQGARLEKEYRRLLVSRQDELLLALPFARIDEVVLVGRVGATTPALHALLDAGIGLTFLTRWGKLRGRLAPAQGGNLPLRHWQYRRAQDPAFCLEIGRDLVAGKLRNYRNLARRMARSLGEREQADASQRLARIDSALAQLPPAPDLASLRGLEGSASRAYFGILRASLPQGLRFARRSRRPPKDPPNALLSLGYTLLTQNLVSACEIVGLDPFDGYFHSDKYNRPALALDLVEEFRGVIVDSVVRTLLNRRMLTASDFRPGPEGGVYLQEKGLRVFFRQYARRLETEILHPDSGRRLSYRKIFEVQARRLRRVIEGSEAVYRPFMTR